jgi:hypothetical protein
MEMASKEDSSSSSSLEPLAVRHFVEKIISDFAAASNFIMAAIDDKPGLYRAMAGFSDDVDSNDNTISSISFTSHELANKTGTNDRYIREWLYQQFCAGYILHDTTADTFVLPKEHAIVLADEKDSPAFMGGAFQLMISALRSESKVIEAFKTGNGIDWSEHDSGSIRGPRKVQQS